MLTQAELKEHLHFDAITGIFTRKVHLSNYGKSKESVGYISRGYVFISVLGIKYLAHRLAWLYMKGSFPKDHIDHIDGNKSNNSLANLRDVNNAQNHQNIYKANANNQSKMLGVKRQPTKKESYQARIKLNYKCYCLGSFGTPQEAHEAYLNAKRNLHNFSNI